MKKIMLFTLCLFASFHALADKLTNLPVDQIIKQHISNIQTGHISDFRLAWGQNDPAMDKAISDAIAKSKGLASLSSAINATMSHGKNSFAGVGQTCVITLYINNNGVYRNDRTCTTEYVTRYQMDTMYYSMYGLRVLARLPNIDFIADNLGYGWAGFYTPTGNLSELIAFVNGTN